jgi:hypothetical protein
LGSNDSAAPELQRDSFRSTLLQVKAGADDGIRTRDLRFTKPLLYQLSYVGKHIVIKYLRKKILTESNSY